MINNKSLAVDLRFSYEHLLINLNIYFISLGLFLLIPQPNRKIVLPKINILRCILTNERMIKGC